jgi:hypothetical protein
MSPPPEQLPMIERIERAMVLLAYFIELDGDVHVPMFEKFEAELKELKQTEDAKSRARRLLERHGLSHGLRSIEEHGTIARGDEDPSPPTGGSSTGRSFLSAALTADPAP